MAKIATFLIMAVVWVILSGMFDPFHLTLGVICCGLVAHFSHGLLFWGGDAKSWPRGFVRWILYIPSLFWEIILANIHVIRVVVHPRMLEIIDPQSHPLPYDPQAADLQGHPGPVHHPDPRHDHRGHPR